MMDVGKRHRVRRSVVNSVPADDRASQALLRHLGVRLARRREAVGLAAETVAKLARITPAQLSGVESGHLRLSGTALLRLCEALEIPLSYVFSDASDQPPSSQAPPNPHVHRGRSMRWARLVRSITPGD